MIFNKNVTYYDDDEDEETKPVESQTQKWSQQSPDDPFSSPPTLDLKNMVHDDDNYDDEEEEELVDAIV